MTVGRSDNYAVIAVTKSKVFKYIHKRRVFCCKFTHRQSINLNWRVNSVWVDSLWPVRQVVKSPPFHGGVSGSNPGPATK